MNYCAEITYEGRFVLAEFPDCPGCQTFVEVGEDFLAAATEALNVWLESLLDHGEVPPMPRYQSDFVVPVGTLTGAALEFIWSIEANKRYIVTAGKD
jgi:predicted RNase H-like HicB family nuclease